MSLSLPLSLPVAVVLASAVTLGVAAPAFAATAGATGAAGTAGGGPSPGLDRDALREAIAVRPDDGAAGVVAEVHKGGERWRGASGDVVTGQPVSRDAHFRIGSVSKPMEP
ncbi:hypothetical protein [Streptomyces sp. NBC_01077]|uniref:hypothetical protein n=1 Tax=Streptomyces sp. NBC_01077 TaxID=2903746 RepID=UPI00386E1E8D